MNRLDELRQIYKQIQTIDSEIEQYNRSLTNDDTYVYVDSMSDFIPSPESIDSRPMVRVGDISESIDNNLEALNESIWNASQSGNTEAANVIGQLSERYKNEMYPLVEKYIYMAALHMVDSSGYDISTLMEYAQV